MHRPRATRRSEAPSRKRASVYAKKWGAKVSPSTVSDLNQKIYSKIEECRMQPITGEHPYVFVDGVYLKRSWGGEVQNVSVLVAVGVNDAERRRRQHRGALA